MTRKMRSYVKGLILSLCGKPLPLTAKKEPVAYLYNGVRLPKLPEWDRVAYPYAVISVYTKEFSGSGIAVGDYDLCLCKRPLTYNGKDITQGANDYYLVYRYSPGNAESGWVYDGEYDLEEVIYLDGSDVTWANPDILHTDGTVYLAASEPIPVYE